MSAVTTWTSGVYHLLHVCWVHIIVLVTRFFKLCSIKHRKQHKQYESTNRKISDTKHTIKLVMLLIAHSNADIFKEQCGWFHTYKHNGEARWNTQHNVSGSERNSGRSEQRTKEGQVRFVRCTRQDRTDRTDVCSPVVNIGTARCNTAHTQCVMNSFSDGLPTQY